MSFHNQFWLFFFRIGTLLNLSFDPLAVALILSLQFSMIRLQLNRVKAAKKIEILPSLVLKLLDYIRKDLTHRGSRELGRDTDTRKICIELLHFYVQA